MYLQAYFQYSITKSKIFISFNLLFWSCKSSVIQWLNINTELLFDFNTCCTCTYTKKHGLNKNLGGNFLVWIANIWWFLYDTYNYNFAFSFWKQMYSRIFRCLCFNIYFFGMHSKLKCAKALFVFILLSSITYTGHHFNKQLNFLGMGFLFSFLHQLYLLCSDIHSSVHIFCCYILCKKF